ncbi:Protein involved in plasmid maintenance [Spraguea lophii 42_110]|uniref:Protein involved in plasmid maintenance n=1 Tax=Spraguea lophii (strain 42_110) TaxID=1358809 RepID=S7W4I2_SPRLO|nr:Protein involved in plasmid maintenance [Spraguea lophii 42_110]
MSLNLVNNIFYTVSDFYKNINPSTISGVNDVIVVESADGVLSCSPFQIKFGTIQMFRISEQIVYLHVNGNMTDISMRIGYQGELYFEDIEDSDSVGDNMENGFANLQSFKIEKLEATRFEKIKYSMDAENYEMKIFKNKKYYTEDEIEFFRSENYDKRSYYKKNIKVDDGFYSVPDKSKTFSQLLDSYEHTEFLIKNHEKLFYGLKNLLYPDVTECKNVQNLCFNNCKEMSISYSKSSDKKLIDSADKIFELYRTRDLNDSAKTIVELKGCKNCSFYFYIPFIFFNELFFTVREIFLADSKNKKLRFLEFLENKCESKKGWFRSRKYKKRDYAKCFILDSSGLKKLGLTYGPNEVIFKVDGAEQRLSSTIYLWKDTDRIVVSDIDGTITKSDVMGHICDFVGKDWTHKGIAKLLTKIERNGYHIVYLSSRAIGQHQRTENMLNRVSQDEYSLPQGPIILSPDGIFGALYRELIRRRPEDFKISCLKTIKDIFNGYNPFIAGFGNRINDVITYKALDICDSKIFTTNPKGEVYLELKGTLVSTYSTLNTFVDSIFPAYSPHNDRESEKFSDLYFWRF